MFLQPLSFIKNDKINDVAVYGRMEFAMSRQTEKMFKEFERFLQENDNIILSSEDAVNDVLKNFMSQYQPNKKDVETADDYLELAISATTKKESLKYAKKALELEPDNFDAGAMVLELSCTSSEKLAEKYKNLINEAEEKLKEQGYFEDENIGNFWLIFETRPYMRLLEKYASHFVQCGQMRLAISVYEKMLKLCINDNIGVRYILMHLYTFLEDEQSSLELYEKYPEEGTQFLLPLSILYYKLGDLRKSNQYLKKLIAVNKDTYEFFNNFTNDTLKDYLSNMSPYGYRPFIIEEFIIECEENYFLFSSMPEYFVWAKKKVSSKRNKK